MVVEEKRRKEKVDFIVKR